LAVAAEVSFFPDPSDRLVTVLIFFGVEEDGLGAGATTFGGRDVAGGAKAGGVVAIGATVALGGEGLGSGEAGAVFGGS
jgi:hypothetical protein